MALTVQKYGGTSLGSIKRIKAVAKQVAKAKAAGDDVVVVVSAMAGETDRLLKLAHQVAKEPEEREVDLLLSSGERVTSALLTLALQEQGLKSQAFTGPQVGILTE